MVQLVSYVVFTRAFADAGAISRVDAAPTSPRSMAAARSDHAQETPPRGSRSGAREIGAVTPLASPWPSPSRARDRIEPGLGPMGLMEDEVGVVDDRTAPADGKLLVHDAVRTSNSRPRDPRPTTTSPVPRLLGL